jgi:hypothetical protein
MRQPTPGQVKTVYRRAIAKHFQLKQKDIKQDIHEGSKAPGRWSPGATLEIYCESGIPNASDYHDMRQYTAEFGLNPKQAGYYCHAEQWSKVDDVVNALLVEKFGRSVQKYHHEPYSNAVVAIYPDY